MEGTILSLLLLSIPALTILSLILPNALTVIRESVSLIVQDPVVCVVKYSVNIAQF